jgi:phosphohistidine phosphatase SixA
LLLLRHADAGERLSSPALDRERRLNRAGRADAERLTETFAGYRVERIVTSPHRRCLETVVPSAAAFGLEIELREELVPNASTPSVLALLDELPAASLVCTHREVIERLVDGQLQCEKGAAWLLDRNAGGWIPVAYLPSPASVERARGPAAVACAT